MDDFDVIMLIFFSGEIFWIWMLTDWFIHEPKGHDKFVWFLIMFFLNAIGAFIYLTVRYRSNRLIPPKPEPASPGPPQ